MNGNPGLTKEDIIDYMVIWIPAYNCKPAQLYDIPVAIKTWV